MYEETMISVKDVSKSFETKEAVVNALDHVNLEIHKGEIYGIIGMSGAGKSTLVRCLNFLERPTTGTVCIEEHDLSMMSEEELRKLRTKIAMIFQHFNLLMQRTVLDNICFPLEIVGMPKKKAREKAAELLKIVDLEEKAKAYPSQLSGGQKQRVAIARAMVNNPKLLLADEPTGALDSKSGAQIMELFQRLNDEGVTIVMITHDKNIADHAKRVYNIIDGEISEAAPKADAVEESGTVRLQKETEELHKDGDQTGAGEESDGTEEVKTAEGMAEAESIEETTVKEDEAGETAGTGENEEDKETSKSRGSKKGRRGKKGKRGGKS